MQKSVLSFFALILLVVGGVGIWIFVHNQHETNFTGYQAPANDLSIEQPEEPLVDKNREQTTKSESIIPSELYEQLDVSDIEILDISIANEPDLWRAFLASPAPMSDPFFEFGCLEYQDTGARLTVNLFVDNADRYWVAEVVNGNLIGVGELSFIDYDLITAYRTENEAIACLQLLIRQYDKYYLLSEEIEFQYAVQAGDPYPLGYDFILLVENAYLPVPMEAAEFLSSYTGAGREPLLVANRYLLGYGEGGINLFDLGTWEYQNLFGLNWDMLRGVSNIITYDDESAIIAFAYQIWDDIEPASVIVYDLGEDSKSAKQYQRYATFKWTMGSNEVFTLEDSSDLIFNSKDEIWITEYPEFDEKIVSGDYPPDAGKSELTEWKFLE